MEEQWKKIIINNQETVYSVSNYGRVRNDKTMTFLNGSVANNGYKMVHLRYRIEKNCSVHRLVMKAFSPCPEMDDLQINHKDGNKLNNHINNLEWSTGLENMRHSYETGLQPNKMIPCFCYDLEGNFLKEYTNSREAAQELNLDYSSIWRCVREEREHYKIYQFKAYKKDKIPAWSDPKKEKVYVYKTNGDFFGAFNSQKECAQKFGVAPSSICRYLKGKRTLDGFIFSRIPL